MIDGFMCYFMYRTFGKPWLLTTCFISKADLDLTIDGGIFRQLENYEIFLLSYFFFLFVQATAHVTMLIDVSFTTM